jgi:hypothetical protein
MHGSMPLKVQCLIKPLFRHMQVQAQVDVDYGFILVSCSATCVWIDFEQIIYVHFDRIGRIES